MMFIVRNAGDAPTSPAIQVKASRGTPTTASGGAGKTDYFCVGDGEAIAALRAGGWEIVELRDGWYAGDNGGGVGISGHGRYWERGGMSAPGRSWQSPDTVSTAKHAGGPPDTTAPADADAELVNVRGAIFGV
jgi:hypothetical protein